MVLELHPVEDVKNSLTNLSNSPIQNVSPLPLPTLSGASVPLPPINTHKHIYSISELLHIRNKTSSLHIPRHVRRRLFLFYLWLPNHRGGNTHHHHLSSISASERATSQHYGNNNDLHTISNDGCICLQVNVMAINILCRAFQVCVTLARAYLIAVNMSTVIIILCECIRLLSITASTDASPPQPNHQCKTKLMGASIFIPHSQQRNFHYRGGKKHRNALSLKSNAVSNNCNRIKQVNHHKEIGIKIGLMNCRSLNGKSAAIQEYVTDEKLDLLVLTETWLKGIHNDHIMKAALPPDFDVIRQDRPGTKRGGGE